MIFIRIMIVVSTGKLSVYSFFFSRFLVLPHVTVRYLTVSPYRLHPIRTIPPLTRTTMQSPSARSTPTSSGLSSEAARCNKLLPH